MFESWNTSSSTFVRMFCNKFCPVAVVIFLVCQEIRCLVGKNILQHQQIQHDSTTKLTQLFRLNNIQSIHILFDEKSIDESNHLIESISKLQKPTYTFEWNIVKLKPTSGIYEPLANFTAPLLMLANSQRKWYILFAGRLEFGRETFDLCMTTEIRDNHHLSLVIVLSNLDNNPSNERAIIDYLHYVWAHVHPSDLLAIVCAERNECVSYRYNPEVTTIIAKTFEETMSLYKPADHSAAMRRQRPINVEPERFVVKFTINFLNAFIAIDMAHDSSERLVGFHVWTAHLLAEMLHKPLHLVLMGMTGAKSQIADSKLHTMIEQDLRISTSSLLAGDRIEMTTTLTSSMEEYTKYFSNCQIPANFTNCLIDMCPQHFHRFGANSSTVDAELP